MKNLFSLLILSFWLFLVTSHPNRMSCSTSMTVGGSNMMGGRPVSDSSRTIVVKRQGATLTSGSSYVAGETLTVSMSSTSGGIEYKFEASGGGSFSPGQCSNRRPQSDTTTANIVMPASGTVNIWAGWSGSQSTVRITPSFILNAASDAPTRSPTSRPTTEPTAAPTVRVTVPTASPSAVPTAPSAIPTASPTRPTANPTTSPTPSPTTDPTPAPTNVAATVITNQDTTRAVLIAVIGSLATLAILATSFNSLGSSKVSSFFIGTSCAFFSLGLAAALATNNTTTSGTEPLTGADLLSSQGFMGTPKWTSNPIAWHPVLMVAYFTSQTIAMASWSIINNHGVAKVVHILMQSASTVLLSLGLWAVISQKLDLKTNSLVSMHSWVGVMSASLFFFTFLFGAMMALLTQFNPNSTLRKNFDLRRIHQRLGLFVFFLTAAAIVTGVSNQYGQYGCGYVHAHSSTADVNPAQHYDDIPTACKISNGLGVLILLSAGFCVLAVVQRHENTAVAASAHEPVGQEDFGVEMVRPSAPPVPAAVMPVAVVGIKV